MLGVYTVLLIIGFLALSPRGGRITALVLTVLLVFICWLKGERPEWRWGRDRE